MTTNCTPDSSAFQYNAPQYLDFTTPNIDYDKADEYFDHIVEDDCRVTVPVKAKDDIQVNAVDSMLTNHQDQERCHVANGASNFKQPVEPEAETEQTSAERNDKLNNEFITEMKGYIKQSYLPSLEGALDADSKEECKIVLVETHFETGVSVPKKRNKTVVQPFSFEERHKQLKQQKEEKIQKILEEEKKMREFHANPVPSFTRHSVRKGASLCTDPQEPRLRSEERIQERKHHKCEEEPVQSQFKARPAIVLQKRPFEPKKGENPLTDVTEFHLNTEVRAKKREEYNILIMQKEAELEMLKHQRKEEEEKKLAEEIRQMRKNAVHKANPVPQFKPLPPLARIPLTEPKSPRFASRKRQHPVK